MPELTFSFPAQILARPFYLLAAILLLTTNRLQGQSYDRQAKSEQAATPAPMIQQLLPEKLGEKWRAISAVRTLSKKESAILPDADVHAEYELLSRTNRVYTDGKSKATIAIFEMRFASGAYGLFTFNRGSNQSNQQEFHKGRYLISISSNAANTAINNFLAEAIRQFIPVDTSEMPVLPSHLPEQNKITETEKYLVGPAALTQLANFSDLKEVVNFASGAEAVAADYQNGSGNMSLLIVEYHTPQLATEGHARFQEYLDSLSQSEKDRRLLRRIGNYVVEAIGIQDVAAAESIIGQIKYSPKVYWEGRKMRDIPLEFRPPDPAALEEASQTAKVMIRAIYWIGAMLLGAIALGMITGGAYFYWRRYRRRKLGIDDLFSDAGGAVRLNLDDYLLSSRRSPVKQIGNSEK